MTTLTLRQYIALPILGLALTGAALAADFQATPVENARLDDFAAGKKAMEAKKWAEAASSFSRVVAQNPKNADAYNYLGYSNRWLGKYDDAFAAYNKALTLDPKHRGALEYSGIAYLKTGQKAQAEAQLAKLQAICGSCEETTDLAKAITAAK
ncbi:tetratricopeptide repeat protein [Polaromonas sp.]|uniref:tetratricopeptide repeat protein n=1 Tax=Polaromonas sp. TaxID=1869339 RepID=UPI002736BD15|nr:tetratricopeptide repeat protein [Polaromonas sp.]MDP3756836.1 tetratricopeptide repeat protein [Polaromonas sp.]